MPTSFGMHSVNLKAVDVCGGQANATGTLDAAELRELVTTTEGELVSTTEGELEITCAGVLMSNGGIIMLHVVRV